MEIEAPVDGLLRWCSRYGGKGSNINIDDDGGDGGDGVDDDDNNDKDGDNAGASKNIKARQSVTVPVYC